MPKGYWVANVDVTNPDAYKKYVAANAVAFKKYGARFLTRGGKAERVEGKFRARIVLIEFPDFQAALDCYRSPEYGDASKHRVGASVADIVVLEGYEGAQP
jgi:uncharacterized protein (DUF1330 family)